MYYVTLLQTNDGKNTSTVLSPVEIGLHQVLLMPKLVFY